MMMVVPFLALMVMSTSRCGSRSTRRRHVPIEKNPNRKHNRMPTYRQKIQQLLLLLLRLLLRFRAGPYRFAGRTGYHVGALNQIGGIQLAQVRFADGRRIGHLRKALDLQHFGRL
uniref:Putative secreted protein n=1 Tax=Anopheles darlingi TaxID=43151 RepID=A0A2M4DLQ8_ANODA